MDTKVLSCIPSPGVKVFLETQRLRNCHAGDGNRFSNTGVLKLFPSKGILRVRVVCGIFQVLKVPRSVLDGPMVPN